MKLLALVFFAAVSTLTINFSHAADAPLSCKIMIGEQELLFGASYLGNNGYASSASFDGEEMKAVGDCYVEDRPGTRYVRCSHESDDLRLEIYPQAETPSGSLLSLGAVLWTAAGAQNISQEDCE